MIVASTNDALLKVQLVKDGTGGIDAVALISVVLAMLGFGFGLFQFFIGRRWKRIEYLESQIKRLREEKSLVAACLFLDWEERDIVVGTRVINFKMEMLKGALRDHRAFQASDDFSEDEAAIRDTFDAFFDYLGGLQYAIDLGMLKLADIQSSPAAYFIRKIIAKDEALGHAFANYLTAYEFHRVKGLLQGFRPKPVDSGLDGALK